MHLGCRGCGRVSEDEALLLSSALNAAAGDEAAARAALGALLKPVAVTPALRFAKQFGACIANVEGTALKARDRDSAGG
jgi:hypothetical protein